MSDLLIQRTKHTTRGGFCSAATPHGAFDARAAHAPWLLFYGWLEQLVLALRSLLAAQPDEGGALLRALERQVGQPAVCESAVAHLCHRQCTRLSSGKRAQLQWRERALCEPWLSVRSVHACSAECAACVRHGRSRAGTRHRTQVKSSQVESSHTAPCRCSVRRRRGANSSRVKSSQVESSRVESSRVKPGLQHRMSGCRDGECRVQAIVDARAV
jgi:hypothetical protein